MSEDFKVCPQCDAEYFSHIQRCAACGVDLIFPNETSKQLLPKADGDLVCIIEGPYDRIYDHSVLLNSSGIEAQALNMKSSGSCATTGGFGLFVAQNLASASLKIIEEYAEQMYPELKQAEERLSQGLCPACGADIKQSPDECPDCGLSLKGVCSDDGCGDCGSH